MSKPYDAIVVGARCAGLPTAMLLARRGWRVLAVDRARFPSDTLSTHVVQALAAAALARWGLLARLRATGCPSIHYDEAMAEYQRARRGGAGDVRDDLRPRHPTHRPVPSNQGEAARPREPLSPSSPASES